MISKNIEDFLGFLRETEQQYNIAVIAEKEKDDATQDILHAIELEKQSYHQYALFAKELCQIRKDRRVAKDFRIQSEPIISWIDENKQIIKSLERLLGDVRKIERKMENRTYIPKVKSNVKSNMEQDIFND